jgi:hypothetical protein
VILGSLTHGGYCQNNWTTYPQKKDSTQSHDSITVSTKTDSTCKKLNFNSDIGHSEITKDKRIGLIQKTLQEDKKIIGYTVQIEVSQQNNIIKETKLKFIKSFPEEPIFDQYIAPNTYLFAGRFFDKNDALFFQHQIKEVFSNTMVIKKAIEPPFLKN